ncbi:MAG: alpha/beta hydrolase [Roseateles sp.]|uniref:alpha/beta fold hydrolase n=1 Tax=Roseateles sp. TaxID=1971397 RepID=UPI0039EB1A8F
MTQKLKTRFLEMEGGRIAYDDTGGAGPLVVAIPGMGDLRSEYRFLAPRLVQEGYRVVTMDVRGFGETSAQWDDVSAHAVGSDAVKLITHLNAGPAIILGNSFAAGSALWAAFEAPELVCGAVLLGPLVRDQEIPEETKAALTRGFSGPGRVAFWTNYWDSLFTSRKPADHPEVKAELEKNLHEPGRMETLMTMLQLSKSDTANLLEKIRIPALIVMGSRDPDFPDANAEAYSLGEILRAEVFIVEGAGHYPHAEMPDLVAPKIFSFIDGLKSRDVQGTFLRATGRPESISQSGIAS